MDVSCASDDHRRCDPQVDVTCAPGYHDGDVAEATVCSTSQVVQLGHSAYDSLYDVCGSFCPYGLTGCSQTVCTEPAEASRYVRILQTNTAHSPLPHPRRVRPLDLPAPMPAGSLGIVCVCVCGGALR